VEQRETVGGASGSVQCTIAIVSRSLSIAFGRYTIRLSDESSRMAKRKHLAWPIEAPYRDVVPQGKLFI